MNSLRLDRWASPLQPPRNPRLHLFVPSCPFTTNARPNVPRREVRQRHQQIQSQIRNQHQRRCITTKPKASTTTTLPSGRAVETRIMKMSTAELAVIKSKVLQAEPGTPPLRKVLHSAKLSALHARLSLPTKLPLQTLARCLIDPSVDLRKEYNNSSLALLGQELLGYYTSEWLICKYPRIPMGVLFAAQYGYVGPATLNAIRIEWGVETVAEPGQEVDAGLLQLESVMSGDAMAECGTQRVKDALKQEEEEAEKGRLTKKRGMARRIAFDDQFGEFQKFTLAEGGLGKEQLGALLSQPRKNSKMADGIEKGDYSIAVSNATGSWRAYSEPVTVEHASAGIVRALAGALYLHAGTDAAKSFHRAHILSRYLPLHKLFVFTTPTRDLSRLCDREGFEPPVARLISETGRLSRTPVFVVGVFSGDDKLGEGAGSSLDEGRTRAAAAALRSWYLYSPPESELMFPSDVEGVGKVQKPWKAQLVDPGEIVT